MAVSFEDIDRQLSLSVEPHRVQSLKSYRNSLAPVSRLPHILLTDIFILIHDSEHKNAGRHPRFLTCLRISHICRAWRDSALQCPLLWTNILFHPPEWTAIMLDRSKTAPLTVRIAIEHEDPADHAIATSVRLALTHIRHIRYLSIVLLDYFYDLSDLLSPFLTGSPDILEELILTSVSVFPNIIYPFMMNAPCLRSLHLRACHINWQLFSSVGNLTSLVLKDIPFSSSPSIEHILSLLRSMSKLESLTLIHAISELPPSTRTLPPHDIAPLKLEHLFNLSFKGYVLDCANLIRHFVIPRCRQVSLNTVTTWLAPAVTLAVPPLASIISSSFGQLDKQEAPYVASINRPHDNSMTITACPAVFAEELRLDMSLIWSSSPPGQDVISTDLGNLLTSLPSSRIVHFSASLFCREDHQEDVEWLKVLPRLSRVETVVLSGGYSYGFMNAFHDLHATDVSSLGGGNVIALPNLTSLTIRHAHFSFPLGDAELFSTLTRALKRRLELDWTVPKITLIGCYITPQQLVVLNTVTLEPVRCTGEPQTWGVGESDLGASDEDSFSSDDEDQSTRF